jgi:membrane-bound lytic murein transglycosylase B
MTRFFLLLILCSPLWGQPTSAAPEAAFNQWLAALRQQALEEGVSASTLDAALTDLAYLSGVVERQNSQPESKLTIAQYLQRVVNTKRLATGRRLLAEHADVLEKISQHYNVQPRFIVALWGHESDYGRYMGGTPVIAGLASLAYKGRRQAYFRTELLAALQILDEGHVSPKQMQGSWAGALGQCQFMSSNFKGLAVDFNGDGRRDIWHTSADVFASIANYLAKHGWQGEQTWGRQVTLPTDLNRDLIGYDIKIRLGIWQRLGVRRLDGNDLPKSRLWSTLLQPDGTSTPAYIVYENFHTLMRWNRSTYFALAIGQLANRY